MAQAIGDSGGGAIVNISSISGMWGMPFAGAYTASKWGVRGLTKVGRPRAGPQGRPGQLGAPRRREDADDGWRWATTARATGTTGCRCPRIGTVDDIADAVLFLASDEAAYITGTELVIDGGTLAGDLSLMPPRR